MYLCVVGIRIILHVSMCGRYTYILHVSMCGRYTYILHVSMCGRYMCILYDVIVMSL